MWQQTHAASEQVDEWAAEAGEARTLWPEWLRTSLGSSSTSLARVPATAKSAMMTPFLGSSHHASNSSLPTQHSPQAVLGGGGGGGGDRRFPFL